MCGHSATDPALPPAGRLKTRPEFLAVRAGERRNGPYFLLELRDRGDGGAPRVGYTVTKRQGNAVERNRMRRRLREAVRLEGRSVMSPGHDYVLVGRRELLDVSFSRLTSALKARIEGPRATSDGRHRGKRAPEDGARERLRAERTPPDDSRPEGEAGPHERPPSRMRDGQ